MTLRRGLVGDAAPRISRGRRPAAESARRHTPGFKCSPPFSRRADHSVRVLLFDRNGFDELMPGLCERRDFKWPVRPGTIIIMAVRQCIQHV